MRFRFVHAADLHLDSPMRGLGARQPHLAALFGEATRKAFIALVDRTIALEASFLVIAGDVYDGDWKDHGTGLFFLAQLSRLARAGIPVFLIRGNHDAESLISRSLSLPENVHLFGTRKAETREIAALRVALHGRSFAEREVAENIALAYPPARAGWLNIGILHTSLDGRPEHAPYAPCSLADLRAKGYDYWALGHIHAAETVASDPYIVFPGNLQGRQIRETGPKGAVLVEVADGIVESVAPLIVDVARWARLTVDAAGAATPDEVVARAETGMRPLAAEAEDRPLALRLVITGETPAHRRLAADRDGLAAEMQAAADRVAPALYVEKLLLETAEPQGAGLVRPAIGLIDPAALLDEAAADPAFAAALTAATEEILAKLPDELREAIAGLAEGEAAAEFRREARDLAFGRLAGAVPA
jgi:exonuclease SbcD